MLATLMKGTTRVSTQSTMCINLYTVNVLNLLFARSGELVPFASEVLSDFQGF